MGLHFSHHSLHEIESNLKFLRQQTGADFVLLADNSGQFIGKHGQVDLQTAPMLSALVAAQVAATEQVAILLGSSHRFQLLQEGGQRSIYVIDIQPHFVLSVIFRNKIPLTIVRQGIRRIFHRLKKVAQEIETMSQEDVNEFEDFEMSPDWDWQAELDRLLGPPSDVDSIVNNHYSIQK